MPKITKRIYDFEESINNFMIYCTNKDLTKKTMKSYESTLKLFAKYLADKVNTFTPLYVTTKNIKDYLEFTRTKGKYSYVADSDLLKYNNPSSRGDFGKQISMYTVNNYLRNIKVYFTWLYDNKITKSNPVVKIKAYKHSIKPKKEIKDVDLIKF